MRGSKRHAGREGHADRKQPSQLGEVVASGDHGNVWLSKETLKLYRELQGRSDETSIKEARTLARCFERFASKGPQSLDNTAFKPLGRTSTGRGGQIQVFEFKAYQYRIYGVLGNVLDRPCFVGLATDESKKKQKANPRLIEAAAELSREWV